MNNKKIPWNKGLRGVQKAWNKGKKWKEYISEEGKKNIIESLKNRSGEKAFWYGKVGPRKGMHNTKEQNRKIGITKLRNKNCTGKHLSEETKRKMHESQMGHHGLFGKDNPRFGITPPEDSGCYKWYWVNNVHCQGTYEKRFAEACFKYNVSIERNQKRFYFGEDKHEFSYGPDFYCKDYGLIEIKGLLNQRNLKNLNECKRQNIKILLVFKKQLREFERNGILIPINILETDLSVFPARKD